MCDTLSAGKRPNVQVRHDASARRERRRGNHRKVVREGRRPGEVGRCAGRGRNRQGQRRSTGNRGWLRGADLRAARRDRAGWRATPRPFEQPRWRSGQPAPAPAGYCCACTRGGTGGRTRCRSDACTRCINRTRSARRSLRRGHPHARARRERRRGNHRKVVRQRRRLREGRQQPR